ncbi:MAG: sterol desaturase family protein [Myxococcota bacterium]
MSAQPIQNTAAVGAIHRHERRHAAVTLAIAALVACGSVALHRAGLLRVETALPGTGRFAVEVALFVFAFDFYFYGLHRLLHTRWLYRVHAVHHLSKQPRPLTALSFHPVESFLLLLYPVLVMALVPIHLASVSVGGTLLAASIALAHWRGDFFPTWWLGTPVLGWIASPSVHEAHHRLYDCNFSATTSIPDRLFGTYRLQAIGVGPRER